MTEYVTSFPMYPSTGHRYYRTDVFPYPREYVYDGIGWRVTDAIPSSAYDPEERIPEAYTNVTLEDYVTTEPPEPLTPDEPSENDEPVIEDDDGETNGGEA